VKVGAEVSLVAMTLVGAIVGALVTCVRSRPKVGAVVCDTAGGNGGGVGDFVCIAIVSLCIKVVGAAVIGRGGSGKGGGVGDLVTAVERRPKAGAAVRGTTGGLVFTAN